MTLKVNIIGGGRVGESFAILADRAGYGLQDVASRSLASAEALVARTGIGHACAVADLRPADLWLLTVPDGQIAEVADMLLHHAPPPACAVHCSGFHPASLMAPLRAAGWTLASLHPVRSFADPSVAADEFAGTFCGIEGDSAAQTLAFDFAKRIGGQPFAIRSEAKALYHGAAVFSNNFTTVLQAIAREAWAEAGVPDEIAAQLQAGLLRNALENVTSLGPQAALTGPAARGDTQVVDEQGAAVSAWHPEAGALYRLLSTMAARLKKSGKT